MDAKPHRPRVLRLNDENLPPSIVTTGKSLHTRTKSTPALSLLHATDAAKVALNHKKVLGDTNMNMRVGHKDDIEVGKVSPAKLSMQAGVKDQTSAAPLARPAVRPLAPKAGFAPNTHTVSVAAAQGKTTQTASKSVGPDLDAAMKVAPKKSKILKDALPTVGAVQEVNEPVTVKNSVVPLVDSYEGQNRKDTAHPSTSAPVVVHQEVRRPENVPLRAESVAHESAVPVTLKGNASSNNTGSSNVVLNDSFSVLGAADAHTQPASEHVLPKDLLAGIAGSNACASVSYNVATPTMDQFPGYDFNDDDGFTTGRTLGYPGENTDGLTLLFTPRYTERVLSEIAAAKAFVEASRPAEDIEDEQWDTSMVAEYGDEIFEYMRQLEKRMAPNAMYMDYQHEIQWSMRGVLLDWVVQVHHRFNLLPETLFLAINYIDRFLSIKVVSMAKLQLVGATALFLAAKYEEVNCPSLSDIVYMVDGTYTAEELLRAERFMLNMLQFELGWPGPMSFLRRISKADDYDLETRTLSKYFLEVTIMDERFVGCQPSFLAAGAHCLARIMLRKGEWTQAHVYYSNYTILQLRRLVVAIWEACKHPTEHHGFVYEKYCDKRYKRAALFVRTEMDRGFTLSLDFVTRMASPNFLLTMQLPMPVPMI